MLDARRRKHVDVFRRDTRLHERRDFVQHGTGHSGRRPHGFQVALVFENDHFSRFANPNSIWPKKLRSLQAHSRPRSRGPLPFPPRPPRRNQS